MPIEIALAASARAWPDTFHRFLLDHGGGVLTGRVMGSDQALAQDYQVLLIDDICSFLTPRLVTRLRDAGRDVIGVFSPEDGTDAKRRLLECGISDVVEADATPEEFLEVIASTLAHRAVPDRRSATLLSRATRIGVIGAATGVGCTEVSIALAASLSAESRVVLVDLDQRHPGLAQRLDLPLHPNLHTAVDAAHHEPDRLGAAILAKGGINVVGGVARPSPDRTIPVPEIAGLLEDLSNDADFVVVDLGPDAGPVAVDVPIVVGEASPVGLRRLIERIERETHPDADRHALAIVNRAQSGSRKADDIRQELMAAIPGQAVLVVPDDKRVGVAGWDGDLVLRGRFTRSVASVANLIAGGDRHDG